MQDKRYIATSLYKDALRNICINIGLNKTKERKLTPLCGKQLCIFAVVSISVYLFSLGLRWASHDSNRGKEQVSTKINCWFAFLVRDLHLSAPMPLIAPGEARLHSHLSSLSMFYRLCGHNYKRSNTLSKIWLVLSSSKLHILPGLSSLVAQQSAFGPDVVDWRMQQRPTIFCAFCFISRQRLF